MSICSYKKYSVSDFDSYPKRVPPRLSSLTISLMAWFSRFFRGLGLGLLAIVLIFEEWGWESLAAVMARLDKLPFWGWLERKITALPRWAALAAFGVPMLLLLPVKLLALLLFARGQALLGLVLLLLAKLAGTALLAWLFTLTQPALMQFAWFAYVYPRWKAWKDALLTRVRASAVWRAARELTATVRAWMRAG